MYHLHRQLTEPFGFSALLIYATRNLKMEEEYKWLFSWFSFCLLLYLMLPFMLVFLLHFMSRAGSCIGDAESQKKKAKI